MKRGVAGVFGALALTGPAAAGDDDATRTRLGALRAAIEQHRTATGELPGDARQLGVVVRLYKTRVPLVRGAPVDAWERPFVYALTADTETGYRLYSTGANGNDEAGGGDDLQQDGPGQQPEGVERAIQLLPVLLLVVLAPIAWTLIRAARRDLR